MTNSTTLLWRLSILAICVAADASHAAGDSWTGKDKAGHAAMGAAVGSVVTAATQSPTAGCLLGAGVGLAKEAYDAQHPDKHTASAKDFIVTAAAACLAAKFYGLFIGPRGITYSWEF